MHTLVYRAVQRVKNAQGTCTDMHITREKCTGTRQFFSHAASSMLAAKSDQNSAAKAVRDAQASRPSRPMAAAALLHRHSRLCRRLAAPRRLAATSSSPSMSARSTGSSKTERKAAEKTPATLGSMVVMMVVDLAALCANESNAKWGERGYEGCG